jgi:hypothetical protein
VFENGLLATITHEKPEYMYLKKAWEMLTQMEAFGAYSSYKDWIGIGSPTHYPESHMVYQ